MDTKLKKSKLIRAYFYRTMAFVMMFFMIFIMISFYPKYDSLTELDYPLLLNGEACAIPEFRETTEELFNNLMLATFDVGDENGVQLDKSGKIRQTAKTTYEKIIAQGGYYFCIFNTNSKIEEKNNIGRTVFSQTTGKPVIPDSMELCYYWDTMEKRVIAGDKYTLNHIGTGAYKPVTTNSDSYSVALMVYKKGFSDNNGLPLQYQREATSYGMLLWGLFISFTLFLLFSILSLFSIKAGRKASEKVANVTGYLLLEVKSILTVGAFIATIVTIPLLRNSLAIGTQYMTVLEVLGLFGIGLFLSFIRNDMVRNRSLIFRMNLIAILIRSIRKYAEAGKWEKKFIILTNISLISGLLLSMLGITFFTYQAKMIYVGLRDFIHREMVVVSFFCLVLGISLFLVGFINANRLRKEAAKVAATLSAMRHGEVASVLSLPKHAYLEQTVTDVNELEKGIEQAVEQKSKADRMQVELITNVSHDLKTPLTSIINYADLLCEEPLEEKSMQYATAIQEKSYHLKNMVQDVFELSKASTGNLVVEKHTLDIIKLLYQTLADIDEKIKESSLSFKTQIPEGSALIEGDGDKLYRVFLNLYMNSIHYSLENSRVYTIVKIENEYVSVQIKNTSRNELSFDTDEIMERFVRADKSRTDEGSGLGLSIAKSFTEACGGTFLIETDADMFTAITRFPLSAPKQEEIQGGTDEMA